MAPSTKSEIPVMGFLTSMFFRTLRVLPPETRSPYRLGGLETLPMTSIYFILF